MTTVLTVFSVLLITAVMFTVNVYLSGIIVGSMSTMKVIPVVPPRVVLGPQNLTGFSWASTILPLEVRSSTSGL